MAQRVIGLEDALRTLKQIDPVYYRTAQKNLKKDLAPLVSDVRSQIPGAPPLSRWVAPGNGVIDSRKTLRHASDSRFPVFISASAKRRVGIIVRRQRVKGFTGRRALVALRQSDAAGEVFDMAGKHPNQFGSNLSGKFNLNPSRLMWPMVEKHRGTIDASMEKAKREMEGVINAQLRSRRGAYDKDVYDYFRGTGWGHESAMHYARKTKWV